MKPYAIGVDVGGTTVKIGIFRTEGTLTCKWEIPTRTEEEGSHILPDIAASVREKLAELQIPETSVEGLGIGVPGPVTGDGVIHKCVNLGWGVFNIEETMSGLTGLKVKAGNDAKMACGFPERVKEVMGKGALDRSDLERCAKRVLGLILKID